MKTVNETETMNTLQTITFVPGLELRCIEHEGTPWFIAADVCRALDLDLAKGTLTHTRKLDRDDVSSPAEYGVKLPGKGMSNATLVSESGLYSLVLRSRKPEAQKFRNWVTSEVLPAIRKNGGYMTPAVAQLATEDPEVFMARALVMANETIQSLKA